MPRSRKPNSLFYIFLIFQFLLSITIINSAVIRREKRSFTTNVTVDNEVDPGSVTTNEDVENLLPEGSPGKDETTTSKTIQVTTIANDGENKNIETTLSTLTVDENTVGSASDSQESQKPREKVDTTDSNVLTTTKVSMSKTGATTEHEEISTIVTEPAAQIDPKRISTAIESEIVPKEHTTVVNERINDTTIQSHEAETPQMTTLVESDLLEHTTFLVPIETTTNEKLQSRHLAEEDSTSIPIPDATTSRNDEVTAKHNDGETISEKTIDEISSTKLLKKDHSEGLTDSHQLGVSTTETVSDSETSTSEAGPKSFPSTMKLDENSIDEISSTNFVKTDHKGGLTESHQLVGTTTESVLTKNDESSGNEEDPKTFPSTMKLEEKSVDDIPTTNPIKMDHIEGLTGSNILRVTTTESVLPTNDEKSTIEDEPKSFPSTMKIDEKSIDEISTTNTAQTDKKEGLIDTDQLGIATTATLLPTGDETEDGSNPFPSLKLDDTTALLTETETSDEEQTRDDEVRNSTPSGSSEKRGKFIAHNYSSFNELNLPNTSDVWALAGLKVAGKPKAAELQQNSVETSEEKPVNDSIVTKNLLDWTRVMETTPEMNSETTLKNIKKDGVATTEATDLPTTTESVLLQQNEVDVASTKVEPEETTISVAVTSTNASTLEQSLPESKTEVITANADLIDVSESKTEMISPRTTTEANSADVSLTDTSEAKTEHELETTTNFVDQSEGGTIDRHTTDDIAPKETETAVPTTVTPVKSLKNHEDERIDENKVDSENFEKEIPAQSTTTTTTTTTTTPIPDIVTMKSETTNSHVSGETIQEATNAGTTSLPTTPLVDFTTSIPNLTPLTSMTTTTTTTTEAPPTTPITVFNIDDAVNESPNMESTQIPMQSSSPSEAAVEVNPMEITTSTTKTTTTTMPAVTIMAETTETQTTTEAPHTPAIISNDTTMIHKSNNYNEYEVVNKTTEKSDDSSSTEAIETTTRRRVAPNWSTKNIAEPSTTEVDNFDFDLDVTTTASTFENSNEFDIDSTATVIIGGVTLAPNKTKLVTTAPSGVRPSAEDLDHIDPIHKISDTAESSIESNVIDPLHVGKTSTTVTTSTTTTETSQENMKMQSNDSAGVDLSSSTSTPTTTSSPLSYDDSTPTLPSISTNKEDIYSIVPTIDKGGFHVPKLILDDSTTLMPPHDLGIGSAAGGGGGGLQPMDSPDAQETDVNVIIAISVSTVGIIALILLVAFLYVMRKRQKQMSYGQRCRPVSLDAYSLDNVSVYNSVRRKGATLRASKRSYGNVAFDDPSLRHNVLGTHELAKYVEKKSSIWEEFKEVPQIIARADEVPAGCEDKNRYANVIPLPETRVILQQQNGDEKSEYINANYVRGPKDTTNYYIACQAPLETTVNDFWRMIWEQNSRVIIMATDLIENGIEKCSEYLPPSVTLDNHTSFGDYQVLLKHREVKEKYAISTLTLKNTATEESREITHYWYQWPEAGVPTDEAAIIAMLLEARSSLKLSTIEEDDNKIETIVAEDNSSQKVEINGNVNSEKQKPTPKDQGPLTIHCSPGTGRTGTILACDVAMRCLEEPKRSVDIPQIVYSVRRGRASAVQTKEQYEFIYKVTHMYATKISNINNDN